MESRFDLFQVLGEGTVREIIKQKLSNGSIQQVAEFMECFFAAYSQTISSIVEENLFSWIVDSLLNKTDAQTVKMFENLKRYYPDYFSKIITGPLIPKKVNGDGFGPYPEGLFVVHRMAYHGKLETMKFLADQPGFTAELKDCNGNTVDHNLSHYLMELAKKHEFQQLATHLETYKEKKELTTLKYKVPSQEEFHNQSVETVLCQLMRSYNKEIKKYLPTLSLKLTSQNIQDNKQGSVSMRNIHKDIAAKAQSPVKETSPGPSFVQKITP